MLLQIQQGFDYYNWLILPLIIFCTRIGDVTLGTVRSVMSAKGFKKISPLIGFFEALIWILVVSQVMKNINNVACYFAWAGGFATGTYVGLMIEERLALGIQVIRIITNQDFEPLVSALKSSNHGVTIVDGKGAMGPVKMIYTIVKRKNVSEVEKIIQQVMPAAFYSIEDVKGANAGVFSDGVGRGGVFRRIFAGK